MAGAKFLFNSYFDYYYHDILTFVAQKAHT